MIENTSTLYKMIILYMLKKVTFPLSNSQITNFLLDHEYTTYFHIQQTIHDLMDTHLTLSENRETVSAMRSLRKGKKHFPILKRICPIPSGWRWTAISWKKDMKCGMRILLPPNITAHRNRSIPSSSVYLKKMHR